MSGRPESIAGSHRKVKVTREVAEKDRMTVLVGEKCRCNNLPSLRLFCWYGVLLWEDGKREGVH